MSENDAKSNYIDYGVCNTVAAQREEPPLLPFGNPIGFVPAACRGVSQIIKSLFNLKHHLIWTDGNSPGTGIEYESGKV